MGKEVTKTALVKVTSDVQVAESTVISALIEIPLI
jgi:hypothetical protein